MDTYTRDELAMTDTAECRISGSSNSSDSSVRPSWSAGVIGATFTPPSVTASSTAPTLSFPSVLRLAKGLFRTRPVPEKQARQQKSGRLGTGLLGILMVMLIVGAGLLIWKAFAVDGADSVEAPLPAGEFAKPAGDEPVGPTGDDPVDVDGAPMTAADMGPNTLFIPALGVYMPVEASEAFVSSRYNGFDTLKVPKNPKHGVRYAGGAPLYGGQAGVTMIASHVSSSTGWGALRYLYTLTGGEMIYTKDADGQLQSWQLTEMRVEAHTAFPQEYWSPEGDRYLVVTTCGGGVTVDGNFTENIFAVAVPVDPVPKTAEQLEEESAAEEAEPPVEEAADAAV